jgi:hypothetical protein
VKRVIYGLYILFFVLMVATFYIASMVYDGLVEDRYYEKSKSYFETKKLEEDLGMKMTFDRTATLGTNVFRVDIAKKDGQMSGVNAILFVGNVASEKYDRTYPLREDEPGIYITSFEIPFKGTWLLRLDISHNEITTDRRWTVTIE